MPPAAPATTLTRVRVWDVPTRVVHWLFVVLIPFSWWTAHSDHLPWHRLSGYALLGLVLFRLIWGVWGSPTSRFANFLRGPAAVRAYLAGGARAVIGHNPLGAWSVVALLIALAAQLTLGLFSIDEDSLEGGPLTAFISFDTGRRIAHLHHLVFWLLFALIVLHLAAIGVYALRRRNLVGPMITGVATAPPDLDTPPLVAAWRVAPAAAVAAGLTFFIAHGLKL